METLDELRSRKRLAVGSEQIVWKRNANSRGREVEGQGRPAAGKTGEKGEGISPQLYVFPYFPVRNILIRVW